MADRVCIFYDPQDGRVVFAQRLIDKRENQEPTEHELFTRAVDTAARLQIDIEHLETLLVDGSEFEPATRYRVDLATKRLVKR